MRLARRVWRPAKHILEGHPRHGRAHSARDLALYLGQRVGRMELKALAAACGLTNDATAAMAVHRYENKARRETAEWRRLNAALQMLKVKM